jgi:hypothetical protein
MEKMGFEKRINLEGEESGAAEVLRKYRSEMGKRGGRACARKMTAEERVERARKAGKAGGRGRK